MKLKKMWIVGRGEIMDDWRAIFFMWGSIFAVSWLAILIVPDVLLLGWGSSGTAWVKPFDRSKG